MRKIYLRLLLKNGKMKQYTSTDRTRRLLAKSRHVQFKKAYCKVSYGKKECNFGCICEFYNDGWYLSNKELTQAMQMFLET